MDFLRHNRLLFHLLMGVLLTVVYPMQELFSGNQNIYFLWGIESLKPGTFFGDPLLSATDPYPLFSWLITVFPVAFLEAWSTLLFILLNSVYTFALFGIADRISSVYRFADRFISFLVLFAMLHSSPLWGTYIPLLSGPDLRWMWESGIAEQGVLRGYLQPSMFGVFLLMAVYKALKREHAMAVLCLAPAAMMHANYLFLGALLTLVFLVQSRFNKKAVATSAALLVLVLPYSIYIFNNFLLLDEGLKAAINAAVMAGFDENIHINPYNWLSTKFYLQLVLLLAGFMLSWNERLRELKLSIVGLAVGLTLLAYSTENTTLVSLNPWRLSVILIPISSTLILASVVSSSIWRSLKHYAQGIFIIGCGGLLLHRLFGNGSEEFRMLWITIQLVGLACMVTLVYVANKRWETTLSNSLSLIVLASLVLIGLADTIVNRVSMNDTDQFQVISKLSQAKEPKTVYIIPPSWTHFRLNAQKAVFVDENLIYGPALPNLMNRLEAVEKAYVSGDFNEIENSIPKGISIKLIAPNNLGVSYHENSRPLASDFVLYSLR